MWKFALTFVLALVAATGGLGAAAAHADDCIALGGNPAFLPGECRIDTARTVSDAAHGGPFTIDSPLRITGTGSLVVPSLPGGNALTLIVAGAVTMDLPVGTGGRISGDVTTASGIGATITIEATGNIVVHGNGSTGAKITSNQIAGSCAGGRGGNISLSSSGSIITEAGSAITSTSICGQGEIILVADVAATIKGVISSDSSIGRGGPISVSAGCTLSVGATGRISSLGKDPGADLVHLQGGCDVLIQGKVESSGPGHVRPPANRCHAPERMDKPADASSCVEVWSGGTLTVDATGVLKGEISADTSQSGGVNCCAWIDLLAAGDIKIKGDVSGAFAVHANQTWLNTSYGGLITVKSTTGSVTASGFAIQANATLAGGRGGTVTIEAKGDVTLDEAQIQAKGDVVAGGGYGTGGTVEARSFTGILKWINLAGGITATGDVQPTGTGIPAGQSGAILLTSCGAPINTSSTAFPVTAGTATAPTIVTGACGGAPELPVFALLPDCVCAEGNPDASVVKVATPPVITAGGTATYVITVQASGDANSTNVQLTDVLPNGFSWTLGGADAGACSPAPPGPIPGNTTLTCTFGTMAAGTSKTITLSTPTTTTSGKCPGGTTITNTATITADGDSGSTNNSSGPVTITVKCPDVSVSKTTSTSSIVAGATATYTVVVTATGSTDSTNVVLKDTLPSGLSWTVGGADKAACTPASPVTGGTLLTCNFGTMAPTTTKTITLSATTTTANCPYISNTASVTSSADTNSANNTSGPIKINVSCAADVKVVKTTPKSTITAGQQASYGITVTANGPATSTNVVLKDVVPSGLSWTVGGTDAAACSPNPVAGGATLTCNFGSMAASTSKSITLTATTTAANCPSINNTATVTSDNDGTSTNNSSGPVKITVTCSADVKVVKTTSTPTISSGEDAKYSITVTASGTTDSTNVVLKDTLPSGLSWTVGGTDKAACTPASPVAGGTLLTCNFGTMSPGSTKTITLTAKTSSSKCPTIYNTATVSSSNDSDTGNNSSGPIKITVNCVCPDDTTFAFSGSSSGTGTAGNIRTFTVNGVSVKVSAFSRAYSNGAWAAAYLGLYGPGLGVTDGSEDGSNPSHKVDSFGSRNNYVLFEFSAPVIIDRVFLDSIGADSDMSVWVGTKTDPYNNHNTLSDAFLSSLGAREDNNVTGTMSSRWADINSGAVKGNVVVIAASTSDSTPDDEFKISKLVVKCQ